MSSGFIRSSRCACPSGSDKTAPSSACSARILGPSPPLTLPLPRQRRGATAARPRPAGQRKRGRPSVTNTKLLFTCYHVEAQLGRLAAMGTPDQVFSRTLRGAAEGTAPLRSGNLAGESARSQRRAHACQPARAPERQPPRSRRAAVAPVDEHAVPACDG